MATAARIDRIEILDIEAAMRPTHDEVARQGFVSALRKHASTDLKSALQRDYLGRVEPALARKGRSMDGWRGIERAMATEPVFRVYSAVRYNAQEMGYHSVQPQIERALPEMIDIARETAKSNPLAGSLRLDPTLDVPRYVSNQDVHLAPGCFHSEWTEDDVAQGAVVYMTGRVFGRCFAFRRFEGAVAESVGYWLSQTHPDFHPRRLLDMGTTTGRNIFPYAQSFPDIELHGVDVGAPQLRFGYAQSAPMGVPVHFSQQNAEQTDYPDGHFDLIVSSFFFHELPLGATKRILAECNRLLAPGGMIVHMELPPEGTVSDYDNFYWNWDTANNNEPGYTIYRAQDSHALLEEAGFERGESFSTTIPNLGTFGTENFDRALRGEIPSPAHGAGGWYIFGARKPG